MRILVISDTHIPRTTHDLPKEVYDEIGNVDKILHAGDFVEKELLLKLRELKDTRAVYGNMDSLKVRDLLKPKEVVEVEKCRIGLIHGHGAPSELIATVRKEFGRVDAIVFGHSHNPTVVVKDGVLFMNPGSPTDQVFAPYNSYGILEVENGKVKGKIVKIE
jgi:putative phosphoesterase